MDLSKLEKILSGEPQYRYKQIQHAIFRDLVTHWNEVKTLPIILRENLEKNCPLNINANIFHSQDRRTSKALVTLADGNKIETVLMRHEGDRHTACVSSQVGCPLACTFCATGKLGLKRNLTADEIVEQVVLWNRVLKGLGEKDRITNVVYMGMGEPMLNLENIEKSIDIVTNEDKLSIGSRHVTISTVGYVPQLREFFTKGYNPRLALSLHGPTQELRKEIEQIRKELKELLEQLNRLPLNG
jgi:23S rRNA (adenine2503-C2)-methyltransferase